MIISRFRLSRSMTRIFFIFSLVFSLMLPTAFAEAPEANVKKDPIDWQRWSDQAFEQAAKENKLVILDLEAVWCHWCHVMADTTYNDPKVVELINSKFVAIRMDQDANPDISIRYEDWGWPATVIFTPKGTEIVKRRGYIPPEVMASLLDAVIKDPTPGPSVIKEQKVTPSENSFLTSEQRKKLENEYISFYDKEYGGWGDRLKLIDAGHLEWALMRSLAGGGSETKMARLTLDQTLNLLDPVWGGFFQYSESRDWKSPHYEKIMSIQASYMRLYALAYAVMGDVKYLNASKKVADYVSNFWTDKQGAFYISQDADVDENLKGKDFYAKDDAGRRALGKRPRIDEHIYARENGWMISSLLILYDVTADQRYLNSAKNSAEWILKSRSRSDGGFRHDLEDRAGPYLGDTLAMGQAFLDLYRSTADKNWLAQSELAAQFIQKNFSDAAAAGFVTAKIPEDAQGVFLKPVKQIDENVSIVRFANLLFHYTGKAEYKFMASYAMKYLASPVIIDNKHFLSGILIADYEIANDPSHVTVIGKKDDASAKTLFLEALCYPSGYTRIEWWDRAEGPLPNPDVEYPELEKPAAFLCANKACSTPIFTPEKLKAAISKRKVDSP